MRLVFDAFVLDLDQRRLLKGGVDVHLQPKAFELLRVLVEARPKALSKQEILDAVWPEVFVSENNLATVVRDVRTALGDDAQTPHYIRTAYGYGYAFAAAASAVGPPLAPLPSAWRLIHNHREIVLVEGRTILGRAGPDVIVFDAPTVSRHHAAIEIRGDHATIEDLGSKNGTRIGSAEVAGAAVLTDGVEIRLGSVVLILRRRHDAATTDTV
jgi:DNA-binding winged helix-turn-helix (wHTH) protein